jgi:hypothetical protein
MITNTGKRILGKYLVGHAPAYASYMAFGCGALAHDDTAFTQQEIDAFADKTSLDFEMFRVPITSRGIITNENGVSEVVLTAELPTEDRYEITEIGIYSAAANPAAGSNDSRALYSFTTNESWEYHTSISSSSIPEENEALDAQNETNSMDTSTPVVFQSNSDNSFFDNDFRIDRNERCRFLNKIIAMRGDMSTIAIPASPDDALTISGTNHIHLAGVSLNLNKNAPADQLRVAFSVVNRWGQTVPDKPTNPDRVMLVVEFASSETEANADFSRFEVDLTSGAFDHANRTHPWSTNRYAVVSKELQSLYKSPGFDWGDVRIVKIYTTVYVNGVVSPDFYVALDSIRLENLQTSNALYGLTGYTTVRSADGLPIVKEPNSNNLAEFRFTLDVI